MAIKKKEAEAMLLKKGFKQEDGDHNYYVFYCDGKKTEIHTKTSHGNKNKTLTDALVHKMARQIGLNKKEFKEFVECSLSGDEYRQRYLNGDIQSYRSGHITPP